MCLVLLVGWWNISTFVGFCGDDSWIVGRKMNSFCYYIGIDALLSPKLNPLDGLTM
jgi:hypothetical protein